MSRCFSLLVKCKTENVERTPLLVKLLCKEQSSQELLLLELI